MQKCAYADQYKADLPPTCNGGKGCEQCKLRWEARKRAEGRRKNRIQGYGK